MHPEAVARSAVVVGDDIIDLDARIKCGNQTGSTIMVNAQVSYDRIIALIVTMDSVATVVGILSAVNQFINGSPGIAAGIETVASPATTTGSRLETVMMDIEIDKLR